MWCYYLICVLVGSIVYGEWRDLTMYPLMSRYYQTLDPDIACASLSCEYSGLTAAELNHLRVVENKFRNEYAFNMRISNMYMVDIVPGNSALAQLKALQCLPSTADSHIFDIKNAKLLYPSLIGNDSYHHALEVVIVETVKLRNMTTAGGMKYDTIKSYSNLFLDDGALQWRGGATDMGCGYTLGKNSTYFIDYLVCIYSLVRINASEYILRSGLPCTDCTYYTNISFPDSHIEKSSFICHPKFNYLCSDIKPRYKTLFASLVTCSSQGEMGIPADYMDSHRTIHTIWTIPEEDIAILEKEKYSQCSPTMVVISIVMTTSILCLLLFVLFLFFYRRPVTNK